MPFHIQNSGIDMPQAREAKVLVRNSLNYRSEYEKELGYSEINKHHRNK